MAMGAEDAADVFFQIRSLVSDQLQVISYKWLSRKFSISSNNAKRLLKEFVDKHGNDVQVIYTISGWLKSDQQNYCVKLASSSNIDDTKEEFGGTCSVQVYSIQASIPKESAVIWNSEFIQAEELFNQPPSLENCLRDNRFCGISNSHVTRKTDGKHVSAPPKPVHGTSAFQKDLHSLKPLKQEPVGPKLSSNSETVENKSEKEKVSKPPPVIREPSKPKGQNGKSSSGNSGSLANMWGRASTKPKPVKEAAEDVPGIAATADEQICANEAADAIGSDDDFSDINYKRDSNSRKRRVVFDFSDDEDEDEDENEEKVISLASPPELQPQESTKITSPVKEDILADQKEEVTNRNVSNAGITLRAKTDANVGGKGEVIDTGGAGVSGSPKRRKVLKTRIDDRGREVSEFVWEGEPTSSDMPNQENAAKETNNRTVANKTPALGSSNGHSTAATNKTLGGAGASSGSSIANKAGGNKKPAKVGAKDAKQGNILSFFKKI